MLDFIINYFHEKVLNLSILTDSNLTKSSSAFEIVSLQLEIILMNIPNFHNIIDLDQAKYTIFVCFDHDKKEVNDKCVMK